MMITIWSSTQSYSRTDKKKTFLHGSVKVNDVGYGRKLELRDAKGRTLQLEAANVETRDSWAYHIQVSFEVDACLVAPLPPPCDSGHTFHLEFQRTAGCSFICLWTCFSMDALPHPLLRPF